jgi:hypothetical protein
MADAEKDRKGIDRLMYKETDGVADVGKERVRRDDVGRTESGATSHAEEEFSHVLQRP